MVRLEDELKAYRCTVDPEQFRDIIGDLKAAMYPSWSDEDLLHRPIEALRFCAVVRDRVRSLDLPDEIILGTMTNMRKARDRRRRRAG